MKHENLILEQFESLLTKYLPEEDGKHNLPTGECWTAAQIDLVRKYITSESWRITPEHTDRLEAADLCGNSFDGSASGTFIQSVLLTLVTLRDRANLKMQSDGGEVRLLRKQLDEIRAILESELDRDKDDTTTRNLVVVAVNALAAAQADVKRMDWLETAKVGVNFLNTHFHNNVAHVFAETGYPHPNEIVHVYSDTYRNVIDAAMQTEANGHIRNMSGDSVISLPRKPSENK